MATVEAVTQSLKMLVAAGYAGTVTTETVRAWHLVMGEDVSDAQLAAGVQRTMATHIKGFLPPPALVRQLSGANAVAVDVEHVRRGIAALGYQSPGGSWSAPRRERVREVLGDGIADAYGAVGGERLFASEDTTRAIALRDLGLELREQIAVRGPLALLPPAPADRPRLAPGAKALVDDVSTTIRRRSEPAPRRTPAVPDSHHPGDVS